MGLFLMLASIPLILLVLVIISSDGECYSCGARLGDHHIRHKGKKYCGQCDDNGKRWN